MWLTVEVVLPFFSSPPPPAFFPWGVIFPPRRRRAYRLDTPQSTVLRGVCHISLFLWECVERIASHPISPIMQALFPVSSSTTIHRKEKFLGNGLTWLRHPACPTGKFHTAGPPKPSLFTPNWIEMFEIMRSRGSSISELEKIISQKREKNLRDSTSLYPNKLFLRAVHFSLSDGYPRPLH